MLEFKELHAGYDGVERLHGLSARLETGRLTAVIGPNGCGKSTLMKCAAGLLRPGGGTILLDGRALQEFSDRERACRLSYMPQSRIAPDISVGRLAAHGRYPHLKWGQSLRPADRDVIRASIERVGLAEYSRRNVSRLSGGERQRAYLAMMLAQEAQVLLLDEPTTYLDLAGQFALMELLRELRDEGRCIVVVLHDLALALEYADEILLMQGGNLVSAGQPEVIYSSGAIQSVFGVDVHRSDDGKYIFYAGGQGGKK